MNSSEFKVISDFGPLSTREAGARARVRVLSTMETAAVVTLDFTDARPSPSFADELVGGLAAKLGREVFLRRVRIVSIDAAVRPLLNHVVATRLKQSQAAPDYSSAEKSNAKDHRQVAPV
jgi:STAS-like domain of unknown function (DUF4325)